MFFSMAENKRRDKTRSRGKTQKKKAARKTKVTASAKQSNRRNVSGKKVRPAAKKKRSSRPASKEIRSPEPSTLSGRIFSAGGRPPRSGIASRSAGQSGDVQGLSRKAVVDSESVEELLEEGQAREAAAISGVEDSPDPDQAEVRTREVPEDDVPEEYTEND
jgi:septal ring-binding cell division protein DamX